MYRGAGLWRRGRVGNLLAPMDRARGVVEPRFWKMLPDERYPNKAFIASQIAAPKTAIMIPNQTARWRNGCEI